MMLRGREGRRTENATVQTHGERDAQPSADLVKMQAGETAAKKKAKGVHNLDSRERSIPPLINHSLPRLCCGAQERVCVCVFRRET